MYRSPIIQTPPDDLLADLDIAWRETRPCNIDYGPLVRHEQEEGDCLTGPIVVARDGLSAYEEWIKAGHVGTPLDFLNWLKGPKGDKGDKGDEGDSVSKRQTWFTFPAHQPGVNGTILLHGRGSVALNWVAYRSDGVTIDELAKVQPLPMLDDNGHQLMDAEDLPMVDPDRAQLIYPDGEVFVGMIWIDPFLPQREI
ncbi:hypothetical protein FAES_3240 [Fibrella aestuarina BUZ 2]|uniref:Uncharacterized protein n=1 Tax=Fibrella aestuarina BUZ 2 TaxID=1166018 RepID=I0KAU6_9BACT|nr:hypothetical protein [Fibrella aestuarina]CCH01249.1 hypothetical protein FAES_3240 [Fibrella aestuarina BUZ 2]